MVPASGAASSAPQGWTTASHRREPWRRASSAAGARVNSASTEPSTGTTIDRTTAPSARISVIPIQLASVVVTRP